MSIAGGVPAAYGFTAVVRAMNITANDPTKSGRHSSGMESLARRLMKFKN